MIPSSACQTSQSDQSGPAGQRGGLPSATPRPGTRSAPSARLPVERPHGDRDLHLVLGPSAVPGTGGPACSWRSGAKGFWPPTGWWGSIGRGCLSMGRRARRRWIGEKPGPTRPTGRARLLALGPDGQARGAGGTGDRRGQRQMITCCRARRWRRSRWIGLIRARGSRSICTWSRRYDYAGPRKTAAEDGFELHLRRRGDRRDSGTRQTSPTPGFGALTLLAQVLPDSQNPLVQKARERSCLAPLRRRHHRMATYRNGIASQRTLEEIILLPPKSLIACTLLDLENLRCRSPDLIRP